MNGGRKGILNIEQGMLNDEVKAAVVGRWPTTLGSGSVSNFG